MIRLFVFLLMVVVGAVSKGDGVTPISELQLSGNANGNGFGFTNLQRVVVGSGSNSVVITTNSVSISGVTLSVVPSGSSYTNWLGLVSKEYSIAPIMVEDTNALVVYWYGGHLSPDVSGTYYWDGSQYYLYGVGFSVSNETLPCWFIMPDNIGYNQMWTNTGGPATGTYTPNTSWEPDTDGIIEASYGFTNSGLYSLSVNAMDQNEVISSLTTNVIVYAPSTNGIVDGRILRWRLMASGGDRTVTWPTNIFRIPYGSTMTNVVVISNNTISVFTTEYVMSRTNWLMEPYISGY